MRNVPDDLDQRDRQYEAAEAAFLDAVRKHAPIEQLALAAETVANAADSWNAEAYRRFHQSSGDTRRALDLLTERTEVLQELWADLATAYGAERTSSNQ